MADDDEISVSNDDPIVFNDDQSNTLVSNEDTSESSETSEEMSDFHLPRRKRFIPKYNVEGVEIIELSEDTQKAVGLIIGMDVTSQNPWKYVPKSLLLEHIENVDEESEFSRFKEKIDAYTEDEILFGYIVDESKDTDEYYICLTLVAKEHCKQQSERFLKRQQRKLQKNVYKFSRPWRTLGSEREIIELRPVNKRKLFEVQIKATYPRQTHPEKFDIRKTTSVRDGYVELVSIREKYSNVFRRRVDTAIQSAPSVVNKSIQTDYRNPRNAWTQSLSDNVPNIADLEAAELAAQAKAADKGGDQVVDGGESESATTVSSARSVVEDDVNLLKMKKAFKRMKRPSFIKLMNQSVKSHGDSLDDEITINTKMDIYSNDYPKLTRTILSEDNSKLDFDEYISFTDINTKNKIITCATFHPMWTGIVAIAYGNSSANDLTSLEKLLNDPVEMAVYGSNPVYIWSHISALFPKLRLASDREVSFLSFCPFNENVLIGGCMNGQIVIWDLTNKLQLIEEIEVLTELQERYRLAMQSQMSWMKQIHDKAVIQPAASSVLATSHKGPITCIKWLSPNFTISKTGKTRLLKEEEPRSLIIFTSAEDGTILIWSLSIQDVEALESGKKVKKSKRVHKRPSGLLAEVSPFKVLDRNLVPIYKIVVAYAGEASMFSIRTFSMEFPSIIYEHCPKNDGSGRRYYDSKIPVETEKDFTNKIMILTINGEILKITWEGHDYNTGQQVNSEYCDVITRHRIHDGPGGAISYNHFIRNLFATFAGKCFCLWSVDYDEAPILIKRRPYRLTDGIWSSYSASVLFIITDEGTIEIWDFAMQTDTPVAVQTISGSSLTSIAFHDRHINDNFIGIAENTGLFRLFFIPVLFKKPLPRHIEEMTRVIEDNLKVKKDLTKYEAKWLKENYEIVEKMRQKEAEYVAEIEAKKRQEQEEAERLAEEEAERLKNLKAIKITPQERWHILIDKIIEDTIALKKRINKAQLVEQERPLRELEAQRLEKEKKLLEVMENQQAIFDESVAILFPEAVDQPKKLEFVMSCDVRQEKKNKYLQDYEKIKGKAEDIIRRSSSFSYKLDWDAWLAEGKERRQALCINRRQLMKHRLRLEVFPGMDSNYSIGSTTSALMADPFSSTADVE